jgi:hypothetical protein
MMTQEKERVFELVCPCCGTILWVDAATKRLIKSEKGARKKESLDELLLKEKKKKEEFATKFEATAELEKQKREKAQAKFEKALGAIDEEDK